MGQKVHPIGFRIGVIRDWESNWYADKEYAARLYEDHQLRTSLRKRLANPAIRQAMQRSSRMGARGIKILVSGRLGGAEMARKEGDKTGKIPLHTLRAGIAYGFADTSTTYGNIGIMVWVSRVEILPDLRRQMKENQTTEPFMPRQPRRAEDRDRERGGGGPRGGGGARRGGGGGGRGGGGGG